MRPLPLLLLATLFLPLHSQRCNLSLNRVFAGINAYVWACNCDGAAVGRAQVPATPISTETDEATRATIDCMLSAGDRLLAACEANPRDFDRDATAHMQECVDRNRATEPGPAFSFARDDCLATQGALIGAMIGKTFLCNCRQETFDVILGRVLFLTEASPLGAEKEIEMLDECGEEFLGELGEVCRRSPGDFNLLARQVVQVCCKRARVRFDRDKFKCREAVPDDVSGLKVEV